MVGPDGIEPSIFRLSIKCFDPTKLWAYLVFFPIFFHWQHNVFLLHRDSAYSNYHNKNHVLKGNVLEKLNFLFHHNKNLLQKHSYIILNFWQG